MNIHRNLELLSAYLDAETSGEDHARLAEHLETCTECNRMLAALDRARGSIGSLERPTMTAEEGRVLRTGLVHAVRPRLWRSPRLLGTLGAAAALTIAVVGFSTLRNTGTNETDAPTAALMTAASPDFESEQEVRDYVSGDPEVLGLVGKYKVADVAKEQRSARSAFDATEEGAGEGAGGEAQRALGECAEEVLTSQPYPMVPLTTKLATFKGTPAYLLVYAFATSADDDEAPLDRLQIWLVRRTDCYQLHYSSFRP